MTGKDKSAPQRLADLAGIGQAFEGDAVAMATIENKEVEVLDFKFIPSQFREGEDYVAIQIKMDGELKVTNTAAQVIKEGFRNIAKEQLPAPVTFKRKESKNGRQYWTME